MKKILLMLVICVSSFMIYTNNVNAATYSATKHFTDNHIVCSAGYDYCQDDVNIFNITDAHYGTAYFSFVLPPQVIINNVSVSNEWGAYYTCDIGNTLIYSDNTNGWHVMSAICPMYITPQGLKKVRFEYDDQYLQQQGFYITMGDYWSFTTDNSALDYTTILNSINGNLTNFANTNHSDLTRVLTYQNNIYYQLVDIYSRMGDISTKLDNIKNNSSATASNTEEIKNDIKSDNVSGAEGSADDLKNNSAFQDNTGLSGVISMPLTFVNSLTNMCQPISLNIPYMDVDVTIPCMQSVITDKMPLLANLIKIIVNGFIVYRILLDIFQIVRNAKNPEDDRIEVLDL